MTVLLGEEVNELLTDFVTRWHRFSTWGEGFNRIESQSIADLLPKFIANGRPGRANEWNCFGRVQSTST